MVEFSYNGSRVGVYNPTRRAIQANGLLIVHEYSLADGSGRWNRQASVHRNVLGKSRTVRTSERAQNECVNAARGGSQRLNDIGK